MFTGIVEEVGQVVDAWVDGERAGLEIACRDVAGGLQPGGSVAVEGCCLTATGVTRGGFTADLTAQTLGATTLGGLEPGRAVNLERPLRGDGRFGGHIVQGHVDAVGEVVGRVQEPGTVWLDVWVPEDLRRYVVPRGSVAVAGVSLTVADVDAAGEGTMRVALIPHTLQVTTLGSCTPGDAVNLEVDIVAKYVERLLAAGPQREDQAR